MCIIRQMAENDDLLAWATLVRAPGLDVAGLSDALDRLGSAGAVVAASAAGWDRAAISPAAPSVSLAEPIP